MPHRRKGGRQQFAPQLKYEPEDSFLYLPILEEQGDHFRVPLDTLTILFSIKYCNIKNIKVRFLMVDENKETGFNIVKTLQIPYEIVSRESTPSELRACRLPAWFLPNQRTCIAGR